MSSPIRTIAFVGPGAIGLFYAAKLSHLGAEIKLLLRNDYEAVSRNGISIRGGSQALDLPAAAFKCATTPEALGPVDLVIITLKNTANHQFPALLPPLLGPKTAILTLQNGLGADERLAELFGPERILGGLSFIACNRVAPGVVECFHPGTISLGEFGRPISARAQEIAAWFVRAGIPCTPVNRLTEARWRKLVWNVPFNGLSIATGGLTTDRILADPGLAAEVRALMEEVAGAAQKQGYEIPEEVLQSQLDVTPRMGAYQPSSLLDWKAGREVEVEAIWGEPLRRAQAVRANTPRLALLCSLLRCLCTSSGT